MIRRATTYQAILVVVLASICLLMTAAGAERPNFVIIFTDDQGYGDLSCYGAKHVSTPRIDQMAREGARLTSFYVAAPVCTPSRAGLMTGCYPKRIDMATGSDFGVLLAGDKKGLNPDEITIAEVLKGAGYKTGMFGKWHLGDQPEFMPTHQGFDEFFGIPYSHDIHPFHPRQHHFKFPSLALLDGGEVIEMDPDADLLTKRFTERAVFFIKENKDEPFFLYVPHPIPHRPLHVSPPFKKSTPPEIKTQLAKEDGNVDYKTRDKLFRQAIAEIDWSVGRILDTLKSEGVDENTLVLFTSDNGPAIGSAGALRGRKGSTFEGGMREATVIRWPGVIPAGEENAELMTAMDLLPTFAALAGTTVPDDRVIDGKDVSAVLRGEAKSPHEAFFYHRGNQLQAVRSGNWKLHIDKRGKPSALYDLASDIGEKTNVLTQNKAVASKFVEKIEEFKRDLAANSRPAAFVEKPVPLKNESSGKAEGAARQKSKVPNFVVFLADDMGWGDSATYGHPLIKTPNLDKLASQGVKFTQCYSACGVCSPSRSAILTGRTPFRNGVWRHLSGNHKAHLRASEITYPELLKGIGYETCHVGKWHLNSMPQFNNPEFPQPGEHGYDHWMYTHNNASPSHRNPDNFFRNGKPVGESEGYSAQLVAAEAARWLKDIRDSEKPFALSVWVHEPHSPIATDPKFAALYDGHGNAKYMGNITQLDHALGQVMDALDEADVADNTLVIFTSDNGPVARFGGTTGGLRGGKRSSHEGGIRVPGVVRWPGHITPGTTSDVPVVGTDIFATVLDLVGIPLPDDRTIDGVSMLPAFEGKSLKRPLPLFWRTHVSQANDRVALRIGDWKIVGNDTLTKFQLFEIQKDWKEEKDLAAMMPEKTEEMKRALLKLWKDIEQEGPKEWWLGEHQKPSKGAKLNY